MTKITAALAALLFLSATAAAGQRVTLAHMQMKHPACKLSWGYPQAEEQYITGFRFYVNDAAVWTKPANTRETGCNHLGITSTGTYTIEATAYNDTEESDRSDPLVIDVVEKTITVTPSAITIQITQ